MGFLSGATGDNNELRRRIAFQAVRGVPPAETAYVDFRSNGGPMRISASEINRALISTSGEPLEGLVGKRNLGGGPFAIGDMDPSNPGLLMMAINALKYYTYTDNTTWHRWALGLREATLAPPFLAVLNDNDHLPRTRIKDILMGGFDFGATPNGNYLFSAPFVAGGYDFFGAVEQTEAGTAVSGLAITSITRVGAVATVTTAAPHTLVTGAEVRISGAVETEYNGDVIITNTGASTFTYAVTGTPATPATGTIVYERLDDTLPVFANTWPGNWYADAVDGDIHLKLVSFLTDTWTAQAKVTAAETYGDTFPIKVGLNRAGSPIFVRMIDQDGATIGPFSDQVKVHLPASGTYRAGAEYKLPKRRPARWAQVLSPDRPISSVSTALFIDNEETRFEGGLQLSAAWGNLAAVQDTPGRQGATTERTGNLMVKVTPTRRITDLLIQEALHEGRQVSVVFDSKSDVEISTSGRPFRALSILPALKAFGDMHDVEAGGQNRDEAPGFTAGAPASAFTYEDITTSGAFLQVFENDIADSDIGL